MMGRFRDLTGRRFGRLVALSHRRKTKGKKTRTAWLCVCDCGTEKEIDAGNLVTGHTKSCGCLKIDRAIETNTTHGLSGTRFYQCYRDMLVRTGLETSTAFDRYGGRGINVCERWLTFENFMADMYDKYLAHVKVHGEKNTTLDRVDNDGDYYPENCRWATYKQQALNRNRGGKYLVNGELLRAREIADKYGLSYSAVMHRIRRNWPQERMTEPMVERSRSYAT